MEDAPVGVAKFWTENKNIKLRFSVNKKNKFICQRCRDFVSHSEEQSTRGLHDRMLLEQQKSQFNFFGKHLPATFSPLLQTLHVLGDVSPGLTMSLYIGSINFVYLRFRQPSNILSTLSLLYITHISIKICLV